MDIISCSYCSREVEGNGDVYICECGSINTPDTMFNWVKDSKKLKELQKNQERKKDTNIISNQKKRNGRYNDIFYNTIQKTTEELKKNLEDLVEYDEIGSEDIELYVNNIIENIKIKRKDFLKEKGLI